MKTLLSIVSILLFSFVQAKDTSFKKIVSIIQSKVKCCSAPFAASSTARVDGIVIEPNGLITLSYSDKRPKNSFNLFELYKEKDGDTGIDTILHGKFIQFSVNEKRMRLIRFATLQDTKEVYEAFLQLLKFGRGEVKTLGDLNFSQTIDIINIRLSKWAEGGSSVKLIVLENGKVNILNRQGQSLMIDLLELIPPVNGEWKGVETLACDPRTHAPLAWINFKTLQGTAAFIRLKCATPESELQVIRSAFLHLRSLSKTLKVSQSPPVGAVHFISRNTTLATNNNTLLSSIRSNDKKVDGDTSISISSKGEGWLDKDSLPVGEWKFYAMNSEGKEYLFKSGMYQRTEPGMFKVYGIDSADLAKDYRKTFRDLQQEQVQIVPFIKKGAWTYYNSNGSLWKTTSFINKDIPIETQILMVDQDRMDLTRLIVVLNDNLDEWTK